MNHLHHNIPQKLASERHDLENKNPARQVSPDRFEITSETCPPGFLSLRCHAHKEACETLGPVPFLPTPKDKEGGTLDSLSTRSPVIYGDRVETLGPYPRGYTREISNCMTSVTGCVETCQEKGEQSYVMLIFRS